MRKTIPLLCLISVLALLDPARADVNAELIPDGTYTVKVQKVLDARHVSVVMQNAVTTTLAAGRRSVTFNKIKPKDSLKVSISRGKVLVFIKL
ncbi:MAG: hypothetical protein NVS1B14_05350 [Vulcanimicrobiaceae bacterium]